MPGKNLHLSSQEILQVADGELPPRRFIKIREHLFGCEECRSRIAATEATIAGFLNLHNQDYPQKADPELRTNAFSRARLEARLADAARTSRRSPWFRFFQLAFGGNGLAYISAGLLIFALGAWIANHHGVQLKSASRLAKFDAVEAAPTPNPRLTPGVVRRVALKDICTDKPSGEQRAISISQQRRIFQEYGLQNVQPENYELDYLITPELGGADDIRNMWPEPHSFTAWNSYVKDDLENYLHQLVCERKLDLATAQHDIATDWISAYKKYFQTDRPMETHLDRNSTAANTGASEGMFRSATLEAKRISILRQAITLTIPINWTMPKIQDL